MESTAFLEYCVIVKNYPTFIGFSQASKTSNIDFYGIFQAVAIGCLWLVLVVSLSGDDCFPQTSWLLYIWWSRLSSQSCMWWSLIESPSLHFVLIKWLP